MTIVIVGDCQDFTWSGSFTVTDQNTTISQDSLNYELPVYEDSVFSDIPIVGPIIDWIEGQLTVLYDWLLDQFVSAVDLVKSAVQAVFNTVIAPIITALEWVKEKLLDAWHWVTGEIPRAIEYVKTKLVDVWSWVTTTIPRAIEYIKTKLVDVWHTVTTTISQGIEWVRTKLSDLGTWISVKIPQGISWISTKLSDAWTWITTQIPASFSWIGGKIVDLGSSVTGGFMDMIQWLQKNIADPTLDAIKGLIDKFFAFTEWIPDILGNIWDWLFQEMPGPHTPRILQFFERILAWFNKYLYDPKSQTERVGWSVAGPIVGAFKLIGGLFEAVFNDFMHAFVEYVKGMGPVKPGEAMINFANVAQVGRSALLGLVGLTAAGELVKFFGHIGLGHIAAMIYDMTNYREITGSMMRAFSTAVIAIPTTYYFNELVRPRLPSRRDVAEMYNREIISAEEYSKYLAYEGIPDFWHDGMRRITETPIRYFTLAAIARSGRFDLQFFDRELIRGGYPKDTRKWLLEMFQTTKTEVIKGMMSSVAIKRYREGMTTESQFHAELVNLLGYTEDEWPRYLMAAKIEYATDYLSDMISAYRDAVRKGHISTDQYRESLRRLGIVPERVESYVIREVTRLRPSEIPKPLGPPKAEYETDAGQERVDTLRRQRRKELITRDQEIAGLQGLGVPVDYAQAMADNDDARLAEEAVTITPPPKPLYETDSGKLQVDTIRRERRKELITRDQEIAGLQGLEMPEIYARAIADNDDARLAEKAGE